MIMNLESTIVIAAAEGGVVMAIILIISVISWIVNLIQGNTPQQQKGKNPPRQRPKAEELEQYLEATKSAEERERERERKRQQQSKPARNGGDRRPNKSKQQQQQRPAPAQQQQRSKNDRPGTRLAETHLATTALGQGGRSLLDSQKVDAEVKLDVVSAVQRDISDAVQSDIGVDGTKVVKQASTVHPLVKALRDPQGVRQAILLNEILNRPKSLR